MIVLDSDLLVIDLRYPADSRYLVNSRVLQALQLGNERLAITCQTLLEVIGVLSFNSSPTWTADLPSRIPVWYALEIVPDPKRYPIFASCAIAALMNIMVGRCSLGDATVIEQIRQFAPDATLFLSWNAKHFSTKLPFPALTSEQWWQQQRPAP